MAKGTRRNHGPSFKAKMALAALKGDKTLSELSDPFGVHTNQISACKKKLEQRASEVFESGKRNDESGMIKDMQAKPGQLTMKNDFFIRSARSRGLEELKKMIDKKARLSVKRQCKLLMVARSTAYQKPKPVSDEDVQLMKGRLYSSLSFCCKA